VIAFLSSQFDRLAEIMNTIWSSFIAASYTGSPFKPEAGLSLISKVRHITINDDVGELLPSPGQKFEILR
jgi:hypothetical protein